MWECKNGCCWGNRRSIFLCCIFAMAVEIIINSWFGHEEGNNMIKKWMATNDFISQFTLKRLSQSIWLITNSNSRFTVAYCHCRLRLLSKLVVFIFCYKIIKKTIFNTAPPEPTFFLGLHARGCCSTPTSRGNGWMDGWVGEWGTYSAWAVSNVTAGFFPLPERNILDGKCHEDWLWNGTTSRCHTFPCKCDMCSDSAHHAVIMDRFLLFSDSS